MIDKKKAVLYLALLSTGMHPVEIVHLIDRAKGFFWMTMTVQTPAHTLRLGVEDGFHFIDLTVTLYARDATRHVSLVTEVNVVWHFVDAIPSHWIAGGKTGTDGFEKQAVCLNKTVAVHAGVARRDVRYIRLVNLVVAVATIEAKLADVKTVIVRHRLRGLVSNSRILGRHVIRDAGEHGRHEDK